MLHRAGAAASAAALHPLAHPPALSSQKQTSVSCPIEFLRANLWKLPHVDLSGVWSNAESAWTSLADVLKAPSAAATARQKESAPDEHSQLQ